MLTSNPKHSALNQAITPLVILFLFAIPTLVILGYFLAAGGLLIVAGLVGIITATMFYMSLLHLKTGKMRMDAFFWMLVIILFGSSVIRQLTGVNVSYFLELIVFLLLPMVLYNLLPEVKRSGTLQFVLALFILFSILEIASAYFGRSKFIPAAYQFLTNLKVFIVLALGVALSWSKRTESAFWLMLRWIWVPIFITVILQWFFPSIYQAILGAGGFIEHKPHPFIPGVTRSPGPFHHSAVLATIASFFGFFTFIKYLSEKQPSYAFITCMYFLLLICSGQRQELLAYLITVFVMAFYWKWPGSMLKIGAIGIVGTLFAFALLWPLMSESILQEAAQWGSNSNFHDPDNARTLLYKFSFDLANLYWPLGSGLGTFASPGSVKFDMSLYYDLGFQRYWWFVQDKGYLMDSYWPRYIGELGWPATFLLLIILLIVLTKSANWFSNATSLRIKTYSAMALSAFLFALLASPTSFILAEPAYELFACLFLGITYRMVREESNFLTTSTQVT